MNTSNNIIQIFVDLSRLSCYGAVFTVVTGANCL